MIKGSAYIIDGSVGHAATLKDLKPLGRRAGFRDGFDHGLELVAVGDAVGVRGEAWVFCPLWTTETGAEDAEEAIVAASKEDIAVGCLEGAVGHDGGYGC
jgi:hypothetical protein